MNSLIIIGFVMIGMLIITVLLIIFPVPIMYNSILGTFYPKQDGELWISINGSRLKTLYYGHYPIQCLCEYLRELNYSCGDRFMGCGAVNCECFEYSERFKNDLMNWKSYHSGTFVQGEGLVCT